MKTGHTQNERRHRAADANRTTPINTTALAATASKVQELFRKRFAAKRTARKTCGNMPGSLCVLVIVQNSEEGVDPRTLKQMTGFNRQKVHKILYKLFKHGEIKVGGGGLYVGVKNIRHSA